MLMNFNSKTHTTHTFVSNQKHPLCYAMSTRTE